MSVDPRYSVNCWIAADGTKHPFSNATESGVAFDTAKVGLPPFDFSQFVVTEDNGKFLIAPKADPSDQYDWPREAAKEIGHDDYVVQHLLRVIHTAVNNAVRIKQPKPQTPAAVEGELPSFLSPFEDET